MAETEPHETPNVRPPVLTGDVFIFGSGETKTITLEMATREDFEKVFDFVEATLGS